MTVPLEPLYLSAPPSTKRKPDDVGVVEGVEVLLRVIVVVTEGLFKATVPAFTSAKSAMTSRMALLMPDAGQFSSMLTDCTSVFEDAVAL